MKYYILSSRAGGVHALAKALLLGWMLAGAAYWASLPLHAQVVADGATNTLSNATNGFAGNVFIGTNGSFTLLVLSNNSLLTNSAEGIIGFSTTAKSNEVRLVSATARWVMNSGASVGYDGGFNRLTVSNGALVASLLGNIGTDSPSASNNTVVVNGAGSVWSNVNSLVVGNFSVGNRLEVSGGGWVVNTDGTVGSLFGGNQALVTGANSIWSNRNELTIGFSRGGNQLVVSNGGLVLNNVGYIGRFPGGSNNVALVTGAGSLWTNQSDLYVGVADKGNQLVVRNGGSVMSRNSYIGTNGSSDNNLAVVTGAGSLWSSANNLFVGVSGARNQLVVSNGGTVFGGNIVVGVNVSSTNNRVVVDGGTLRASNLYVGSNGAFNLLVVSNSGAVFGGNVVIGSTASSTNGRVVVDGGTLRATNAAGTSMLDVRRGTNVLNAGLVDVDQLVLTNRGTSPIPNVFGDSSSNHIPANGISGPASAYPSTIAVAGLAGLVTKVSVTLSNLTYEVPRNLDILLVSPGGQKVMLMSDAGSGFSVSHVRLTFDDTAATLLPPENIAPITSGTYHPTDYQPGDIMPGPAPAGPYSTNLSSFNGINPNGDWSLYITRDSVGAAASTDSLVGWGLQIEIEDLFFDPAVFEFNGGTLITRGASINNGLPFVVGGPGDIPAIWNARAGLSIHFVAKNLIVGNNSSFNKLLIPGGVVVAGGANVLVGRDPVTSTNNLLHVNGGTLRALNPGTMLDVRGGTNRLDAGLVDVNRLVVTNARGHFEFNGGTLRTPDTSVANGRVFTVGNGASSATLQLIGGPHTFSNNLVVASNASLIGNGLIEGTVTVSAGGKLIPGAPIGRISVLGTVILQGTVNLQIDKSGGVRTNDQMTASGAIFYGGTLNVADIGTDVLAAGDRFPLFDAAPYVGGFTTITLPPLGPGLSWANHLLMDGSIEVVAAPELGFASISLSGTNVVISGTNGAPNGAYTVLTATNVGTPLNNWVSLVTNHFDSGGNFSFRNAIAPGERQRYFRIRTP